MRDWIGSGTPYSRPPLVHQRMPSQVGYTIGPEIRTRDPRYRRSRAREPVCVRIQRLVQRGNRRGLGVEALEEVEHPAIDVVTNASGLVQ